MDDSLGCGADDAWPTGRPLSPAQITSKQNPLAPCGLRDCCSTPTNIRWLDNRDLTASPCVRLMLLYAPRTEEFDVRGAEMMLVDAVADGRPGSVRDPGLDLQPRGSVLLVEQLHDGPARESNVLLGGLAYHVSKDGPQRWACPRLFRFV